MRKLTFALWCSTLWWLVLTSPAMAVAATPPAATATPSTDEAPTYTGPRAESVNEDTERKIPISFLDKDNDLNKVKLEVKNGTLKVTPTIPGIDDGKEKKQMTLRGTQKDINDTLKSLVYKGALNYVGEDKLTLTFSDAKNNEGKEVIIPITVKNFVASSRVCDPNKSTSGGGYGFWGNWSAGPTISYSLVQYNLADKKSSINAQAAGGGISFRYYSDAELTKFGEMSLSRQRKPKDSVGPFPDPQVGGKYADDTDIRDVPSGCRAQTYEFFSEEKIHSWISLAPTMYAFQEKDADDFGVQFALNIGLFDDIFTIGAGWNLSGDNAGEWFILAGPSIGFGF